MDDAAIVAERGEERSGMGVPAPAERDRETAERERIAAVHRYAILDTPPEATFDRVVKVAAELFGVSMSAINICDRHRVWAKAGVGLPPGTEYDPEHSLCTLAIAGQGPFVVERADLDERTKRSAYVSGSFGLRFYVGVPLETRDGHNLGALCAFDTVGRRADPEKVRIMKYLAEIVVDALEMRLTARRLASETSLRQLAEAKGAEAERKAVTDELTGLLNRRALERHLDALYDARHRGEQLTGAAVVIDVDGLKRLNDRCGHAEGDAFLRAFAARLARAFPGIPLYRSGGDEFVILFDSGVESLAVSRTMSDVFVDLRGTGYEDTGASFGIAAFSDVDGSPRGALRLADARMYATKAMRPD